MLRHGKFDPCPAHMATLKEWASFYRRCRHRSHRLRLRCLRGLVFGGFCGKHNTSCFHSCNGEKQYDVG